jgi:hypothetical protein
VYVLLPLSAKKFGRKGTNSKGRKDLLKWQKEE